MNEPSYSGYNLIKKVGQGGICAVWQARQVQTQHDLALKLLIPKQDTPLAALKNEYRFLKYHRHGGIVQAFEYIEKSDSAAIVMEFLAGATLDRQCGKLGHEKLESMIVQILEIANFISHCGFIYGDYKPQNFIVDEFGNLRLIDFNLIRSLSAESPIKSGTLGYIAPEILTGRGASQASDIFALGATIYELATGRLPYDLAGNENAVKIITEQPVRPPNTGQAALDEVLLEMLAADAADRPGDYFEIGCRLGLKQELKAKIKHQAKYYFNAGLKPLTQKLVDQIKQRKTSAKPLVIIAGDKTEHDEIYDQISTVLGLDALDLGLSINIEAGDSRLEGQADKHSILTPDDSPPATMHLVNCQNNLTVDIIEAASSLCRRSHKRKSTVCLFAYGINGRRFGNSLDYIVLKDMPIGARDYLNYYLKKHEMEEDWLITLESLAGCEAMVWDDYLESLVADATLEYDSAGWRANAEADPSFVPSKIENYYLNGTLSLNSETRRVLDILAVLGCLDKDDQVWTQYGFALKSVEEILQGLERTAWLKIKNGRYCFSNESRALTIYHQLDSNRRKQLHQLAIEYFAQHRPGDIQALARHAEGAADYLKAARYFLEAAQKAFGGFDYKTAHSQISRSQTALANLDRDRESSALAIDIFMMAGDISKALAEYAEAEKKYRAAADMAEKTEARGVLAGVYRCLADICRLQQKSSESIDYSKKALELYREQADLAHQAACWNNIGLALWTAGDYGGALSNFEQALEINREIDDYGEQAKIYNNLAIIYDQTGRGTEVIGNFEKALDCAEKLSDLRLQTKIYDNIGYYYLNSGNPHRALEYFKKDLELATRIGLDEDRINILSNMGLAYHKIGSIIQSAEVHQQALQISQALDHRLLQAQTCHHLARDCMAMGNYALAIQMLQEADKICRDFAGNELAMEILLTGAELDYALHDFEGCRRLVDRFNEPANVTYMQRLKAEYITALLEMVTNKGMDASAGAAISRIEKIYREARQAAFMDLAGETALKLAELNRRTGNWKRTSEALNDFRQMQVENMILHIAFKLESARFALSGAHYNQAVELIESSEQMAIESGCRPLLFEASLLGARVYYECGKVTAAFKKLKKAEQLKVSLKEAFPAGKDLTCFQEMPLLKEYHELREAIRKGNISEEAVAPK